MDKFIQKNKGPLIAMGSATVGLVLLLLISALVNLPQPAPAPAAPSENANPNIWQNLFWLLLVGGGGAALVLFIRGRQSRHDTDEPQEEEVALTLTDTPHQLAEHIETFFGTTDMNQITTGIQAMYAELEEWRAKGGNNQNVPEELAPKLSEQEDMIAALVKERDKAEAAREKWQNKAIAGQQELDELRQQFMSLSEEELTTFFSSVILKDSRSEDAFLSSKRRQRRLMQRLNAEGLTIMRNTFT